jgi:ketosteroid isomerase-like protein
MRRLHLPFLLCIALFALSPASAQNKKVATTQNDIAAAEMELRRFYESYTEDLRQHRREAIADRYDKRGVYMMGNGQKKLVTFDAVKSRYMSEWKGPKSFQWHDLSLEILAPDVAVVLGRFEWHGEDGKIFKFSYTGVLLKRDGQWRIRVEDESGGA